MGNCEGARCGRADDRARRTANPGAQSSRSEVCVARSSSRSRHSLCLKEKQPERKTEELLLLLLVIALQSVVI
ncbi:hypothetical protein M758_6G011100 [Ceratodon purpureus]|nr:hypothetical protein M758_6G011100 [Ceratodon purpureus]